ncbi:uncharacterized protein LOC128293802 [Gossypium arboreum]|uniref:uncharacterized protein LOC128293802 n=1 Tax=Gossypium arboreum TaxID=29729 RepID=UPI0022F1DC3F|nr:uncharacterized protein LOC128293802 [Gossypium arboreum]
MPSRHVNVRASAQEDGTSSAPPVPLCIANILDEGVGPLIEAMLEHFSGFLVLTLLLHLPILRLLIKGYRLNIFRRWMSYSDEEKLGCVVSLLDDEAYRWWNIVKRAQNVEMFDELVKRAKAVEETLIESPQYVVTKSSKRKFDGASGRPPKRGNDNHSSSRGTRHGHFGECHKLTEVGRGRGHGRLVGQRTVAHAVASQVESKGPTQVNAIRELKDKDTTNVIAATFTLQSTLLFSLVDSSSTYLYILSELACKLGIPVETIDLGMIVISSFGNCMVVNKVYHKCPIMIQWHVFSVDLIELSFYGFDVIIEIVVVGERPRFMPNVVSALKAEEIMGKGCKAYLAYVMNSLSKELRVQDICTIKDFPDMFPEDLLGFPPKRKVDFGIKLYPGSTPMFIVLYYMAPQELNELKVQLQELLDRRFIRPSVSS